MVCATDLFVFTIFLVASCLTVSISIWWKRNHRKRFLDVWNSSNQPKKICSNCFPFDHFVLKTQPRMDCRELNTVSLTYTVSPLKNVPQNSFTPELHGPVVLLYLLLVLFFIVQTSSVMLVDNLVVNLMAIVIFSDSGFPLSNHRNPDRFSH